VTIATEFDYVRPVTLDEAVQTLATHRGEARLLAGGTDLVAWLRDDMITPDLVVDIKRIGGLADIVDDERTVTIGSLVTFAGLLNSEVVDERLPLINEAARTVGSTGIRNRATLVGNICSAVPSCDAGPALMSYEATVEVFGAGGARQIPIDEWFRGPKLTAIGRDEIVTGVVVPVPQGRHGAAYVRLSRYRGEDLAQASVAVTALEDHSYRIAFGAVAATPVRARNIEDLLEGHALDDRLVSEAVDLVESEISPITDMRATEEYRMRMCQVMLRRGLAAATDRLVGEDPPYGTELM
jgi:carbon-monoxide dehydrogenase medium subunit